LYFDESIYSDQTWLRNSILRGNQAGTQGIQGIQGTGPQLSFDFQRDNANLIPELKIAYCNIENITTGIYAAPLTTVSLMAGNIDVPPGFTDDYRLAAGSLCIDQGDPDNTFPDIARNRLALHLKLDQETGDRADDSSERHHTAILFGDKQWRPQEGFCAGALYFDGYADFITANDVTDDLTGEHVTLTGWIKSSAATGEQAIFSFNDPTGPAKLIVGRPDNNQNLQVWYRQKWHDTGIVTFDGNWHFVACVLYDNLFRRRIILYVDGKRESIFENTQVAVTPDDLFSIGQSFNDALYPDRYFNGFIDEVRVYQTPLRGFAINYLFTAGAILAANDEDIDLQPRRAGDRVDIGAYEHQFQKYDLTTIADGDGLLLPSSANYGAGKIVPLTAIPCPNARIKKWHGTDDDNSTDPVNTVTLDQNKTVTVEFELIPEYNLSVRVIGDGEIDPNGGVFKEGAVVALTALPALGRRIKSWSGTDDDLSVETTNTVTVNSDRTVTVTFEPVTFQLTTLVGSGQGQITPTHEIFEYGAVVTLNAAPAECYKIKQWLGTDDDASQLPTNTVTMDDDKTIIVDFELIRYQLNIDIIGEHGAVTAIPHESLYFCGAEVTLQAVPEAGCQVKSWSGTNNDNSTALTNTVIMDDNKTVQVEFQPIAFSLTSTVVGGPGYITPAEGIFPNGSLIDLFAAPATFYRIKRWQGAVVDNTRKKQNQVILDSDKIVMVELEPTAKIQIDKVTVTADRRATPDDPIQDTIEIQGSFDLTGDIVNQAHEINVTLSNTQDIVVTDTFPLIHDQLKNNARYSYTQNADTIKTFKFDLNKHSFSLSLKKVDLTGLTSPLVLDLQIGDYYGMGLAADDYEQYLAMGGSGGADIFQDVINRHRNMPVLLRQGYADTLHIEKAKLKHRKRKGVDSLVIQGSLTTAAHDKWYALITEGLNVKWGVDDYTGSIEPNKFIRAGSKLLFKNNKNEDQTIQSALFDIDKCTFKIVMDNARILSRIGPIDLEISFGDYTQVDNYSIK